MHRCAPPPSSARCCGAICRRWRPSARRHITWPPRAGVPRRRLTKGRRWQSARGAEALEAPKRRGRGGAEARTNPVPRPLRPADLQSPTSVCAAGLRGCRAERAHRPKLALKLGTTGARRLRASGLLREHTRQGQRTFARGSCITVSASCADFWADSVAGCQESANTGAPTPGKSHRTVGRGLPAWYPTSAPKRSNPVAPRLAALRQPRGWPATLAAPHLRLRWRWQQRHWPSGLRCRRWQRLQRLGLRLLGLPEQEKPQQQRCCWSWCCWRWHL